MAFGRNEVRQFSTQKGFLGDKRVNDRVYSYLQTHSYLTQDRIRYCLKTEMSAKNIKTGLMTDSQPKAPSENTIRNVLKLLHGANLLNEGMIDNKKVYLLVDLMAGDYVFIKTKTLQFLIDSCNENTIKVYAFLKWKQELHKKGQYEEQYRFSEDKLLEMLGYNATKSENHKMIQNILDALVDFELIKIHKYTAPVSGNRAVYYYFLDEVREDYKTIFKNKKDDSVIPVMVSTGKKF